LNFIIMGQVESSAKLDEQVVQTFLYQYSRANGVHARNILAGWEDAELRWLLQKFIPKSKPGMSVFANGIPGDLRLDGFYISRDFSVQNIIVFTVSFQNFPLLARQVWKLLVRTRTDRCTFTDYTQFLYKITRGSWEERMELAFDFFDTYDEKFVRRDQVELIITEIAEFMCCITRGLISVQEFIHLKLYQIDRLFAGVPDILTQKEFCDRAVANHRLVNCYEFLDMIFGRVIRQMECDLDKGRVFGSTLQETALGNLKDTYGDMPFVPEVVATAVRQLEKGNALKTEGIFRVSPSTDVVTQVVQWLNSGRPLATIVKTNQQMITPELFSALIKLFQRELKQGVFPLDVATALINAHRNIPNLPNKLAEFQRIINVLLPTHNRCYLEALLPLLNKVTLPENSCENKMNPKALGIVIGPGWFVEYTKIPGNMVAHECCNEITSLLIEHSHNFTGVAFEEDNSYQSRLVLLQALLNERAELRRQCAENHC